MSIASIFELILILGVFFILIGRLVLSIKKKDAPNAKFQTVLIFIAIIITVGIYLIGT